MANTTATATQKKTNVSSLTWLGFAVALIILLILPQLIKSIYWIQLLNLSMIFGICCLGLNFVLGYAGQMSLGQAAFWGIGAYTSALLTTKYLPMIGIPVSLGPWGRAGRSDHRLRYLRCYPGLSNAETRRALSRDGHDWVWIHHPAFLDQRTESHRRIRWHPGDSLVQSVRVCLQERASGVLSDPRHYGSIVLRGLPDHRITNRTRVQVDQRERNGRGSIGCEHNRLQDSRILPRRRLRWDRG